MPTKYTPLIKKYRLARGLTQEGVAKALSMSRPSFIAVESGARELTLPEAEKLSEMLGLSIQSFLSGDKPDYPKYKQVIQTFLRLFHRGTKDGFIPKTKLAKLVYLADFAYYYENLKSMSGMQYRRYEFGPVADPYFRAIDELEESGAVEVKRKGDSILIGEAGGGVNNKLDLLSPEEKSLIRKIAEKWKNKRTQEIVGFTHNQLPYKICAPEEVIPYELITQEDPDHVY